jgi:hypothetical protein
MATSKRALSQELRTYEQKKPEWLKAHENEFVVISKDEVAGFYPDYQSAFTAGVKRFGVRDPFLIKQVCSSEPVYIVY